MEPIIGRLKRVLKLEAGVFQEIGADPAATVQAITVVVATALIGGLSVLIGPGDFGFGSWILSGLFSVVGLAVGAGILYLLSRMFKAQGDYMSLFRSLGYAAAPQALSIIPSLAASSASSGRSSSRFGPLGRRRVSPTVRPLRSF